MFDVPPEFTSVLKERKNQIAVMEALGPVLALMFEPALLSNCLASFWMDNLSALSGFVSGNSTAADLGSISFGVHLCLAKRAVRAWWDYVPSVSNIADGGSREGVADPAAAAAGIHLKQVDFPMSLRELVYADPSAWAAHWRSFSSQVYGAQPPSPAPAPPLIRNARSSEAHGRKGVRW